MRGFYLMHRGWLDHPALLEKAYCRKAAWVSLVEKAAHVQHHCLERGQLLATCRSLAQEWGWSKSRVERFLKLLRKEGMIEVAMRDKKPSIITVCNYDKYQRPEYASPPSDEAHFVKLAALQRDRSGTPYNELNNNKEKKHNQYIAFEKDRQLLEELFVILAGVIDSSAVERSLSDPSEPRRWESVYDWDEFVVPTLQKWAERNSRKAKPVRICAWTYFTKVLEAEFRKKQQRMY